MRQSKFLNIFFLQVTIHISQLKLNMYLVLVSFVNIVICAIVLSVNITFPFRYISMF